MIPSLCSVDIVREHIQYYLVVVQPVNAFGKVLVSIIEVL